MVSAALVLAWLLTGITIGLLLYHGFTNSHEIVIGALVAWAGELLFFSIVGGIVSVVTLKDPAEAAFDERIRILFGSDKLPDSVLSYNKRQLAHLAGYAHTGDRTVIIEEFRPDLQAYRARVTTQYVYRNLMPDLEYDQTLPWSYYPDPIKANPPVELARIISIKMDGVESIDQPIIVDEAGFRTEMRLKIPPKGQRTASFHYVTWIAVDAMQNMRPTRLVEQFSMTIVNQCMQKPMPMKLENRPDPILLLYNQNFAFDVVQSVAPQEKIFLYQLLAPQ